MIAKKQLLLAETVEAIEGGCLLHSKVSASRPLPDDLRGDGGSRSLDVAAINNGSHLIFNRASRNLLALGDRQVLNYIQSAVQNFIEGEFLASDLTADLAKSSLNMTFVERFEKIKQLKHGSLLGNSCKSMVALSGGNDKMQTVAYNFGHNFALALQTFAEIKFYEDDSVSERIEINVPLLFALEFQCELGPMIVEHSDCCRTASKVRLLVTSTDALEKATNLLNMYSRQTLEPLNCFLDSGAKMALINVIKSLRTI